MEGIEGAHCEVSDVLTSPTSLMGYGHARGLQQTLSKLRFLSRDADLLRRGMVRLIGHPARTER